MAVPLVVLIVSAADSARVGSIHAGDPADRAASPQANPVETARRWPAAELHLAVRYGIKMTGMPARKYCLSEQEQREVAAVVERGPEGWPRAC